MALAQELHEARHGAERLGEIVGGDVGELLEVGVRALELAAAARAERLLDPLALGDVDRSGR